MAKWVEVCGVDDFSRSYKFVKRRKEYALFKLDDGIYCLDNVCSHEYSQLHEGMILDGDVFCPKHGSRFEIKSGKVKDFPATQDVTTYPVKIDDGVVYIKI